MQKDSIWGILRSRWKDLNGLLVGQLRGGGDCGAFFTSLKTSCDMATFDSSKTGLYR